MTTGLIAKIQNSSDLTIFEKNRIGFALRSQFEKEKLESELENKENRKERLFIEYYNDSYAIAQTSDVTELDGVKYSFIAFAKQNDNWYRVHSYYESFEKALLAVLAYKLEGSNYRANTYAGKILGLVEA